MQTFLQRIAQKYFENYNSDIQRFTFVFPNRRAGVFFQKYLSELTDKPIFAPVIQTITDFFLSASPLMLADRLGNLFLLYQIFKRHSKNAESFDDFIFWGEVILSDFEEVDKFLVNPKQLFTNVADLKDLDNWLDALTDEQKEVIQRFWANFDPIKSEKGEEFVAMWKILLPIYEDFRAELLAANSATEAMIQRDVVERLQKGEIAEMLDNQYVFVGFNALTACEKQAFLELKKRNRADFYFDYEADELQDADNPASLFFHENKQLFPSKFDIGNECIALNDKNLEYISVPSSVGQAKQIYEILQQLTATEKSQADSLKTAIVLPDENLLIPLLHSFPPEIQQINVTMGFPLKATPAFALFEHVFGLHKRARVAKDGKTSFYYKDVLNILNHRYISENPDCLLLEIKQKITAENLIYIDAKFFENNDFLAQIFQNQSDTKTFIAYLLNIITNIHKAWKTNENADFQLDSDFLYHYYLAFNRIAVILKKNTYNVDFQLDTLIQIIKQFTQGISIPFEGEPLAGLQVMGVLETRLLDFENVIVSSFSEGIFPKRNPPDSFIPQNLRKGFGLPTTDRQDAVSSYNFYRLIARAKRVFFLNDSRTEGVNTAEVSRFLLQLKYHYNVKIKEKKLSYNVSLGKEKTLVVSKTPEILQKLKRFTDHDDAKMAFSASSLNEYMNCSLQFYFARILKLTEEDDVTELVDGAQFGTLFHAAMENIYQQFENQKITIEALEDILKNPHIIDKAINQAFSEKYFNKKDGKPIELEGNNLLIAKILRKYISQILKIDKHNAPFVYLESEKRVSTQIPIYNGTQSVNIKGFIDRMDEKNGIVRVLDYKTGQGDLKFADVAKMFETDNAKRPKYAFQTFLYCVLLDKELQGKILTPGIIVLRDIFKQDFSTALYDTTNKISVGNFADYEAEFRAHLTALLEDIFNPEIPFAATTDTKTCEHCIFAKICG